MKLRLAEYKDGKFEKFLELGDFLFGGDFIALTEKMTLLGVFPSECNFYCFNKDEKDPLNRFNGLFDGRTYGNGRFVLIKGFGDYDYPNTPSLAHYQDFFYKGEKLLRFAEEISDEGFYQSYYFESRENKDKHYEHFDFSSGYAIGNLHENPELFLKI